VVPECFKSSWTCHNQIVGSDHILFYKVDAEMMSTDSLCLFNPNSRCIPFRVIGLKQPDIDSSVYARERTWFSLTQEKGYTIYNQRLGSVSNCTILELDQPSTSQYDTSFIDSKYSLRPILLFANTDVSTTKMCLDTSILAKSIMGRRE
jgi:hypothetical protein